MSVLDIHCKCGASQYNTQWYNYFILHSGRHRLLKCLLEVQSMLIESDLRYILNDLYITDYCVWIQSSRYATITRQFYTWFLQNIKYCRIEYICYVNFSLFWELEHTGVLIVLLFWIFSYIFSVYKKMSDTGHWLLDLSYVSLNILV